jgi:PAS domain S-box-containing protein
VGENPAARRLDGKVMTQVSKSVSPSIDSEDAGWLTWRGERVCLFDIQAGLDALHRAYFDEVGAGAGHYFYQAGLRTAALWAERLEATDPTEALRWGLEEMARRGFGNFRLARTYEDDGHILVVADNSMEAWALRRLRGRSPRPTCSYARGLLAGLWCMAASGLPEPQCSVVCWEIACRASEAPECRFVIGSAEHLESIGYRDPDAGRAVRWEMHELSKSLNLSQQQLTRLERRLAEREQAYQSLLDNMNDLLLVLDANKRVIFCNERFLAATGLTFDEVIGSSPLPRVLPEDRVGVERIYEDLLAGRIATATYLFRSQRPNGLFVYESSARVIEDAEGTKAIEILSRNVTERERARQELEAANKLLLRQQQAADTDLKVAKLVHESLLARPRSDARLDIDVKYVPAGRVGGDYCHYVGDGMGRYLVTLCDVSGHGMAAALLAARVNSHVRSLCEGACPPLAVTTALNEFVLRYFADTGMFVTFFALRINAITGDVDYCGAGHPGALLYRKETGMIDTLASQNLPVGIIEKFQREPGTSSTRIAPGDRLILYTDGVTETTNPQRHPLGASGLKEFVRQGAAVPFFQLGDWLLRKVDDYRAGTPYHDDVSLILLERKST